MSGVPEEDLADLVSFCVFRLKLLFMNPSFLGVPERSRKAAVKTMLSEALRPLTLARAGLDWRELAGKEAGSPASVPMTAEEAAEEAPVLTLEEAGQLYVDAHPEWAEKTTKAARQIIGDLLFVLGSTVDVTRLSHADLLGFRATLAKLPPNRSKNADWATLSATDLARQPGPTLSARTVRNRMADATAFFRWLHRHEYIQDNPAHDLIPKKGRDATPQREAFSPADVERIKRSVLQGTKFNEPDRFWITLLGLYTGARIGELAGLCVDDLQTVDGLLCIQIRDSVDRKLKTNSSVRTLPLHPAIAKAGIADFAYGKSGRLFAEKADILVGKWFNYHVKKLWPGRKIMFHCLRHTVATELQRAGVERERIASVLGHKHVDMTFGTYAHGYAMHQLHEALLQLPY